MHPLARIRKHVFRLTQTQFASLAGATQATVSRWEAGALNPTREQMVAIRNAAFERDLEWSDVWFFEAPPGPSLELATRDCL
ncbi:helix-turn-helix domain-containing protein [Methylobacterium sp. Leaf123]|uniref:helix-turn-helix transcriptional regulator n=1 Tax=Methylobacterium sp. Leaf123 TaxID=1736264 RepID=UPI0012E7FB5F